jgi:hypothetical protein
MSEKIVCPKCGCDVTEALTSQLKTQIRQDVALEWRDREAELSQQQDMLESQRADLAKERVGMDEELQQRLAAAKKRLKARALRRAREKISTEMEEVRAELTDTRTKLKEAKAAELQLRGERQKLQEEKEDLELTVTRRLDEERSKIRDKVKHEAAEEHRLKDAEREELIRALRDQIEILKRKSEQGSQQIQGEVLELDLEAILSRAFPRDEIKPVPKGRSGGDIIQVVRDSTGADCGTIIWEFKRTKNWSDGWLPKLRSDQRAANAVMAILVSDELPKSVTNFAYVEEVWISNRACCATLASALRAGLVDVAAARRALNGQHGKMEILYNYLSSTAFANRVHGIIEAVITMQTDLAEEKRAINARWAKREKQLSQALVHTTGMYGDLQGIIGSSLSIIESLEFPALPSPDGDAAELMAKGFRRSDNRLDAVSQSS